VTANLPQPGERREHMHLAFRKAMLADRLHNLFAAATQFGQVQFALILTERTIAPFLNTVRQILCDLLLETPQHDRTQLRRKSLARNLLAKFRIFALRFVSLREVGLGAEITRLHEIGDTPKIESRFSRGVPVSAKRWLPFNCFTDCVTCADGFLMYCASSRIIAWNSNFCSATKSRRSSE
jgi:hypothetical protein